MPHTLGPWMLHDMEENTIVTVQKPGQFVALADGGRNSPEVNNANACLIAAAPDLLAALQSQIEPRTKGWKVTDWDIRDEQARNAIKRATTG